MSGSTILGNTVDELSAAIGNSLLNSSDQYWSLQLWADSNSSGSLGAGDTFITQIFGTHASAQNAAAGSWATNSVQFDSSAFSSLYGQQLIVLLNNFGDATSESYYDNVTLSIVPEPNRGTLVLLGLGLLLRRRARKLML